MVSNFTWPLREEILENAYTYYRDTSGRCQMLSLPLAALGRRKITTIGMTRTHAAAKRAKPVA
jgi:hypothetical protein